MLGIVAAGKDLNYSALVEGRGAGDYFSLLDLTPALESDGSQTTKVTISPSKQWHSQTQTSCSFLTGLAASSEDGEDKSAKELITEFLLALQDVTAVKESGHIIYLPASYYLREDILQYTEY